MRRLLVRIGVWFAFALGLATSLCAQDRVALVIGNADYERVGALENPVNDANDISLALEQLDFEVFLGLDQGLDDMQMLADRFIVAARTADVALFYFAGHGFQVASQNYLVPTDAVIESGEDVGAATFPLQQMMVRLASTPGTKLVFLDACRDNPFEALLRDGRDGVGDGLARVGNAADFLVSFATQPDNVAYDGAGRNSFFTEAMLNHIHTPGQDISDLMISVRKDVLAATGGLQIPWENSSLTRQFQFDPRPSTLSQESLLWQVAAQSNDPELLLLYASRYPEGTHLPEVLASLDPARAGQDDTPGTARNFEGSAQGERLWELAQRSRARPLIQLYLEQYPDGANADAARRLIDTLPETEGTSPARLCERLATHPRDATASTPGIPFAQLARNAFPAIQACQSAAAAFPNFPHYIALLARATAAAGDQQKAIEHYRDAAFRGDVRALVSLGLLTEAGQGVERDRAAALRYYEAAANGGSPDGMINLAVALFQGEGIAQDVERAVALLKRAADNGSAIATYNLGVLSQDGVTGEPAEALAYFSRAARAGEARGYLAAAILLDEGRGVPADPDAAANMLLRGAAEDTGQAATQLVEARDQWTPETVVSVERRLAAAGHLDPALVGAGDMSALSSALELWRNGGFVAEVLTD